MSAGRRALLDDDEEEEEAEPQLGYNEEYAGRFLHNKKREDLHRLQELQKKGLAGEPDDESSSEEEDEDGLLPVRVEEKIFETLAKIKTRDPSIYAAETNFFEDVDEDEEGVKDEGAGIHVKKQKPLYLKDVNARQLLEGGPNEEKEEKTRKRGNPPPSYHNEQDELKKAFLQSVREAEGEEAGEDLLRVKKRTKEELEREAEEAELAVEEAEQREKDKTIAKRLEEYFGKDDDLDDNDKFLKDYLLNKGWIDQTQKPRYPVYNDDVEEEISADEAALEEQDRFEKDFNFRFQEGDNDYVKGHSRIIDDSVRKKTDSRKKQREKKKERELEEDRARREELKRLKNVKKKEVLEKLEKIRTVAGINASGGVEGLGEDDLDEDFDPDEYDKKMKAAFGDEYYGSEDPEFIDKEELDDVEKPDFDAEDEFVGIASDSGAGFAATKAKLDQSVNSKRDKKTLKVPFEEKLLIDKHLEEYYKLDYEDVVGDLRTRFKYRPVKPNKYGLKTKDIIALEDKELNQFVSLKKLAPYSSVEWEPRGPAPRLSSKTRRKKALSSEEKINKKKKASEVAVNHMQIVTQHESVHEKEGSSKHAESTSRDEVEKESSANAENGNAAEKKKRKRKKPINPSPLPMSRLLSYTLTAKKKGKR